MMRLLDDKPLWLGTWPLSGPTWNNDMSIGWAPITEEGRRAVIERALRSGIYRIDTADVYGTGKVERSVGAVLRAMEKPDDVVVATKVGYFAGTAANPWTKRNLEHQLTTSLDNLGRDHVDLLTLHNNDFVGDQETLRTVERFANWARDTQIVRAIGIRGAHSSHARESGGQAMDKHDASQIAADALAPEVITVRFNALSPTRETLLRANRHHGGRIIRVSKPLGQGLLMPVAGSTLTYPLHPGDHRARRRWFAPDQRTRFDDAVGLLLRSLSRPPQDAAAVMLAYVRHHIPGGQPIVGLRSERQVDTITGSRYLELNYADVKRISAWAAATLGQAGARDVKGG